MSELNVVTFPVETVADRIHKRVDPILQIAFITEMNAHAQRPDFDQVYERISENLMVLIGNSVDEFEELLK